MVQEAAEDLRKPIDASSSSPSLSGLCLRTGPSLASPAPPEHFKRALGYAGKEKDRVT